MDMAGCSTCCTNPSASPAAIRPLRRLFDSSLNKLQQTARSLLTSVAQTENKPWYSSPSRWLDNLNTCLSHCSPPCCLDVLTLDQPVIASVLMHGPGLYVKWSFEQWPDYFQSITSAAGQLCLCRLACSTHWLRCSTHTAFYY